MKADYLILLIALSLRIVFAVFIHNPEEHLFSDMANYHRISNKILEGEWNPYHFFQPIGFPLILAGIKLLFEKWGMVLGLLQALASTSVSYLIWRILKAETSLIVARIGLIITTLHLPWIIYTGFTLSETFFTFFLSLLLYETWKIFKLSSSNVSTYLRWGLWFSFAFLLKGTHIFILPLTILAAAALKKKHFKGFIFSISALFLVVLLMTGILAKNKINRFQVSGSAGGLNLLEGKCPWKWNEDSNGINWISPIYFQRKQAEIKQKWSKPFHDSGYYTEIALQCIQNNPLVMVSSLEGIPLLFMNNSAWPANQIKEAEWVRLYEYIFVIFSITGLTLYFLSLRGNSLLINGDEILIWVIPILSLFICVYVFKSEMRFRIPFDVWFIPVALRGWKKGLAWSSNMKC